MCVETSVKAIEDAFKDFTNREDIAIVMINQYVSAARFLSLLVSCNAICNTDYMSMLRIHAYDT